MSISTYYANCVKTNSHVNDFAFNLTSNDLQLSSSTSSTNYSILRDVTRINLTNLVRRNSDVVLWRNPLLEDTNEGFKMEDDENTTVLSYLKFESKKPVGNLVQKTETILNWNWTSINSTSNVIGNDFDHPQAKFENKRSPVNDMVSKNITNLLENLLKNYENSQLPTHGKGI